MNNIRKIDYENIAGDAWPSFEQYQQGITTQDINNEIKEKLTPVIPIIPTTPVYKENDTTITYQYVLDTYVRGKDHLVPNTYSCNRPWKTVTIDQFTNCILCVCDGWLPEPVGQITDFEKLEDIWDNPIAHQIQNDVGGKKYTKCAVTHCGIGYQDNYESRYQLIFGIDDSCNLSCPSCRRELRMYDSGPLYEKKLAAVRHTIDLLNKFEHPIHITMACSGDPLASYIYRPVLHSYVGKSTQTFTLFTNGLLIKKQLDKTALLNRITEFRISVDAGSESVYEKVRLGGKWKVLLENFDYLKDQKLSQYVHLVFVVQKDNYQDILNFEKLCNTYRFCGTLTHLDDWGTWIDSNIETPDQWTIDHGTFAENNVLNHQHPEFDKCKKIIQSVRYIGVNLTPRLQELIK